MLPVDGWRDLHKDAVVASQAELSNGSQMGVHTCLTISVTFWIQYARKVAFRIPAYKI